MKGLIRIVAATLLLLSLALIGGGVWLISLGGSWVYVLLGVLLGATSVALLKRKFHAFYLALTLLVIDLGWSLYEVGQDFWQLVPRVMFFLGVVLLVSLCAMSLARTEGSGRSRLAMTGAAGLLSFIGMAGMFAGMFYPHKKVYVDHASSTQTTLAQTASDDLGDDWPAFGRNTLGDRYVQFDQINKSTIKDLEVAWTYRTGFNSDAAGFDYEVTPIKVDNSLYLCAPTNEVIAVNATTGEHLWTFDPKVFVAPENKKSRRCRGVSYVETPLVRHSQSANSPGQESPPAAAVTASPQACVRRIFVATFDARVVAINADTGETCKDFGTDGNVDLLKGLGPTAVGDYRSNSAPLIAGNVVIVGGLFSDGITVGTASGVVRAYDVRTGELAWAWDPANNTRGTTPLKDGETYATDSPNFWGTASYDAELGLVYVPTGNQTPDYWTGNRHPSSDEYSDSVVAIDVKTGVDRWHFRTVNRDAFDLDVSAQPILYDLEKDDGTVVPTVVVLTKRGQIFVLDRRNGEPVYPVEQRRVPTDAMPGMNPAETQPYSAISVGADPLRESDMWGATIFDQLYCRIQFKQMRWDGEFTPLSDKKRTLMYPGMYGGFNWGGGAVDVANGTLIANDIRMAQWAQFITRDEQKKGGWTNTGELKYKIEFFENRGTPYANTRAMFMSPLGIPCFKPPFGTMTAIDLKTGKKKWEIPMGSIEDSPVQGIRPGLHIPMGMPTLGGPLVTKGGLTFFFGTMDFYLRAIDNDTGDEVWRKRLPVGGQGSPISYVGRDGRQYIVIVAGGSRGDPLRGDYVIAYALPEKAK